MTDLSLLDSSYTKKNIARIQAALDTHSQHVIHGDTHIATSIVKGLLAHEETAQPASSGYMTLYRETRKGKQFVGGRQIKFFGCSVPGIPLDTVVRQINRAYDSLGINAQARLIDPDSWSIPSIAVTKKEY